ncbi:hypothetical protein [Microbulbifer pacificus]|uniref:DUF4304 domain-containing protein n=1 Tax=Microbulbifer pacificus TaxID=407164 RepID=A0AAU0MZY1_9GAMM|nr:hypothetical protein [Microbulbifer pacificus]WOX06278.1 hypothetical protein R5R33_03900 [Microbulbifer pacificus]
MTVEIGNNFTRGTEAFRFHARAKLFLEGFGFQLVSDPSAISSPYQQTRAIYSSRSGLFIGIWFEPADSNSACINFGRRWSADKVGFALSNFYSKFVAKYDFDLPELYQLGYGDQIDKTILQVSDDIERTLVPVLEEIDLDTLVKLEEAPGGAQEWARGWFGTYLGDHVEISKFDANFLRRGHKV